MNRTRPTVDQFAGVFGQGATPVRREGQGVDGATDPGLELAAEADTDPPVLSSPPRSPAARSSTSTRPRRAPAAAAAAAPPPGLDKVNRHTIDAATRRVVAARRRVDERISDLARAVDDLEGRALPGELAQVITGAGLSLDELPADLAARVDQDR